MSFDKNAFRNACGAFTTGVVIATCEAASGEPIGVTINSFSSVSLDPPLVLFSIAHKATSRAAFLEARAFALNILSAEQRELANRFAKSAQDKFSGVDYTKADNGAPIFPGSLAHFQCRWEATYPGGDHDIILGHVTGIMRSEGGLAPLLYYGGAYRSLVEE